MLISYLAFKHVESYLHVNRSIVNNELAPIPGSSHMILGQLDQWIVLIDQRIVNLVNRSVDRVNWSIKRHCYHRLTYLLPGRSVLLARWALDVSSKFFTKTSSSQRVVTLAGRLSPCVPSDWLRASLVAWSAKREREREDINNLLFPGLSTLQFLVTSYSKL